MKVLQITTNYPNKDNPVFGIFMKEQVESLEQFGVHNTIFFSNGSIAKSGRRYSGMSIHLRSSAKLFLHLLTHKYDIIHCHSAISGLILFMSGGAFFNKCIISYQNDPSMGTDGRFFKFLYPFFNKIIVKKETSYIKSNKVVYLPNGCNSNIFKPADKGICKKTIGLDDSKKYILFVDSNTNKNRVQKRKDIFDKVVSILKDKFNHNDIEPLVMIGVERDMVPVYMNAAELHLLTSDHEGSPNSVKEALSCNVPVVSTNVGNVKDLLSNVPNCYISYSWEPEVLASLVHKSLMIRVEDTSIRDNFLEKGLDINSVAKKLYDLYIELIPKNKLK